MERVVVPGGRLKVLFSFRRYQHFRPCFSREVCAASLASVKFVTGQNTKIDVSTKVVPFLIVIHTSVDLHNVSYQK